MNIKEASSFSLASRICVVFSIAYLAIFSIVANSNPILVEDINQVARLNKDSNPRRFYEARSGVIFEAESESRLQTVWKTDGTEKGTHTLFNKSGFSTPIDYAPSMNGFVEHKEMSYFLACSQIYSCGLWKSDLTDDGTNYLFAAGTILSKTNKGLLYTKPEVGLGEELWTLDESNDTAILVKDIFTGPNSSGISSVIKKDEDTVYFTARSAENGIELWKSDGTTVGTSMVKDISLGYRNSTISELTVVGDLLYFMLRVDYDQFGSPIYGNNRDFELWKSDGTEQGTEKLKRFYDFPLSANFGLTAGENVLFFKLKRSVWSSASELWKSGGTEAETALIPGVNVFHTMVTREDTVYFSGSDGSNGLELWKSDGTEEGTALVLDIHPGSRSSSPKLVAGIGDSVLFTADDGSGRPLWKSDGSESGTIKLTTTNQALGEVAIFNNQLFFVGNDEEHGRELWKTNGTVAGTGMIKDIFEGATLSAIQESSSNFMASMGNGTIMFFGDDGIHGSELWQSDGTDPGTKLVKDIWPGSRGSSGFEGSELLEINDVIYFAADGGTGTELWRSDGSEAGTYMVEDLNESYSSAGSYPRSMMEHKSLVYFSARSEDGRGLWVSNGTEAGTRQVESTEQEPILNSPTPIARMNGDLFFTTSDRGINGSELWRLSNIETVAKKVAILAESEELTQYAAVTSPTVMRGSIYFVRRTQTGTALWKTDGTQAGTMQVFDPIPNESEIISGLTVIGETLYFSAADGMHGFELWRSNGSESGTYMIKDLVTNGSSSPTSLTNVKGELFFFASYEHDTNFVRGLWKSDGTDTGTTLVKGHIGTYQTSIVAINDTLYFEASDKEHGPELWVSDGTTKGTNLVADIREGYNYQGSDMSNLTFEKDALFLFANDGYHGKELWKYKLPVNFDVPAPRDPQVPGEWWLKLGVEVESLGLSDSNNYFGLFSDASNQIDEYDVMDKFAPPGDGSPHVALVFPHKKWNEGAGFYTTDVKRNVVRQRRDGTSVYRGKRWRFNVQTLVGQEVELRWQDLTGAAPLDRMWLHDVDSNQWIKVSEEKSYSFTSMRPRHRFRWVLETQR